MLEVTLNSPEGQGIPGNLYVAMRVGDVQKQAKHVPSRQFSFPMPGDFGAKGVVGKIDVFQRIGSISAKMDGSGEFADIQVPLDGMTPLQLSLSTKGNVGSPTSGEKKIRSKQKMEEAQSYIKRHNLEEALAEAMREVIREKPDDPAQYLSATMLRLKQFSSTRNVPLDSTMYPSATGPMAKTVYTPMDKTSMPPAAAPAQSVPTSKANLTVQDFNTSIAGPLAAASHNLYAKFPQCGGPPRPAPAPAQAAAQPAPAAAQPAAAPAAQAAAPQAASAPQAAKQPGDAKSALSAQSWPSYYQQTGMAAIAQSTASNVYQMFPGAKAASASSGAGVCLVPETGERSEKAMTRLPSVGSWLMRKPVVLPGSGAAQTASASGASAAASAESVPQEPFKYRPSVGSWLMNKNFEVERPWHYKRVNGYHAEYVGQLQGLLSSRDAEIEELKRQLAMKQ